MWTLDILSTSPASWALCRWYVGLQHGEVCTVVIRFLGSCFWEVRSMDEFAQSVPELLGSCFWEVRRMEPDCSVVLELLGYF